MDGDPQGKQILTIFVEQLPAQDQAAFFMGEGAAVGMDTNSFFMDMPLPNRLHHFVSARSTSPEDVVDGLLAKAHGTASNRT
jgi:hypothetical protein